MEVTAVQQEKTDNSFGAAVKSARLLMNITQKQLSENLHITTRYLKAIENSGRKPSYDLLVRIVRELDIPAVTVFYPEYENKKPAWDILQFRQTL
jgi:transcriptional regulator with XRE-family HTH domain